MSLIPGLQRIAVSGGELAVEVLTGTTEPILAIHGISSNRRLWSWLRAESPDLTLIAPDLRGRADSFTVAGPSSVQQHAEDLIAVLDALELDAVPVIGMSMGGFVAIELATRFPSRVKSLVLIDGGFPMVQPPGLTPEMLPAVFADRIGRLAQTWDAEEFGAFFRANTTPLSEPHDPLLAHYLELDLTDDGRVRLSGDALLSDAASIFFGDSPWQSLTLPVRFAHAEWATGADSTPAYSAEMVASYATVCASVRYVEGVDHATSIMSKTGAVVAAELLAEALA